MPFEFPWNRYNGVGMQMFGNFHLYREQFELVFTDPYSALFTFGFSAANLLVLVILIKRQPRFEKSDPQIIRFADTTVFILVACTVSWLMGWLNVFGLVLVSGG
jgi:hypothetical protein